LSLLAMGDYKSPMKAPALRRMSARGVVGGLVGWFDGADLSLKLNSGVGGIIRTNEHRTYKWTINCGPGTSTRAELMGAWAPLTLVSQLSILELLIQGDSKIVIKWLQGKRRLQVISLEYWKDRLMELIKIFQNITFLHVYKEENLEADGLSKHALPKDPEKIVYYQCEEDHEGHHLSLDLF